MVFQNEGAEEGATEDGIAVTGASVGLIFGLAFRSGDLDLNELAPTGDSGGVLSFAAAPLKERITWLWTRICGLWLNESAAYAFKPALPLTI